MRTTLSTTSSAPGTWLRPEDAAAILGCHARTVRRRLDLLPAELVRHAAHGEVPGLGRSGGRVLHRDALDLLRQAGPTPPTWDVVSQVRPPTWDVVSQVSPGPPNEGQPREDGHGRMDTGRDDGHAPAAAHVPPESRRGRKPRAPRQPRQPRDSRRGAASSLPPFDVNPPVVVATVPYFEGWLQVARLASRVGPLVSVAHLELCGSDGERRPTWSRYRRVVVKAAAFAALAEALLRAADEADGATAELEAAPDSDDATLVDATRRPVGLRYLRPAGPRGRRIVKAVSLCELRAGLPRVARVPSCGSVVVMGQATAARLGDILRRAAEEQGAT